MKTLHLTLKKQWFDMIESGEKKEEYREIKPYWISRLVDWSGYPKESLYEHKNFAKDIYYDIKQGEDPNDVIKYYFSKVNQFDRVIFKNGYSGGAPLISFSSPIISIDDGRPEWGAEPGKKYFVIKLGDKIK